jgi:antitoxin component of RelBE/YafQ-DinJ toxin-antitoxin module
MSVTPFMTFRLGLTDKKKLSMIAKRLGVDRSQALRLLIRSGHKHLADIKSTISLPVDVSSIKNAVEENKHEAAE